MRMRARGGRRGRAWRRGRAVSDAEAAQDLVHERRVRAAARLLHHLTDEEPHEGRLARPELLGLLRVRSDDAPARFLDGPRVAYLLHPQLGHHVLRRAIAPGDLRVDLLGLLAADGPAVDQLEELRHLARRDREGGREPVGLHVAQNFALHEVRDLRGLAVERGRLFEERRDARMAGEHLRGVRAEGHVAHEALALGARQLGQRRARVRHERVVQHERRQVRVREVAVVLCLFLAAEAEGRTLVLVPAARLLDDAAAAVEHRRLPRDLVGDGLLDEAKRVDVLQLDARAELRLPGGADAHVGVAAEAPLLEVAVVHADEDEHVAQDAQVLGRLGRAAQVGLAHDLDERRARPVEVHDGHVGVVHALARVLFHVHARDARPPRDPVHLDVEVPVLAERLVELADLVALGQVRIEVVLPREAARRPNRAPERERRLHRHADGFAVQHRQRPRQPQANGAHLRVRRGAEGSGAAAECLRSREELRVHLQADDRLVDHGAFGLARIARKGEIPVDAVDAFTCRTGRRPRSFAPCPARLVRCARSPRGRRGAG